VKKTGRRINKPAQHLVNHCHFHFLIDTWNWNHAAVQVSGKWYTRLSQLQNRYPLGWPHEHPTQVVWQIKTNQYKGQDKKNCKAAWGLAHVLSAINFRVYRGKLQSKVSKKSMHYIKNFNIFWKKFPMMPARKQNQGKYFWRYCVRNYEMFWIIHEEHIRQRVLAFTLGLATVKDISTRRCKNKINITTNFCRGITLRE